MLPTAGKLPLWQTGWAYEIKWDGVRALSEISGGRLRVLTRNSTNITDRFPELGEITGTVGDTLFDGELTVFTGDRLDFGAVLTRMHTRPARADGLAEHLPATMIVFDVLRLERVDLRRRPYEERRAILEGLTFPDYWVVPRSFTDGSATLEASLQHGLEGVVAKRLSSPYVSGRSRHWIKYRHRSVIDATVVGWARRPSGGVSLLLAEQSPTGLVYVGRCTAPRAVAEALGPFAAAAPPVAVPAQSGEVHWVRPEVQVEVRAASREPDGRLRQPRLVRMRLDQIE